MMSIQATYRSAMAKTEIQSLQVFRGLAALAVVAHHTAVSTGAFVGGVPYFAKAMFGLGYLGVDFFFVLSGFIIMYAHMGDTRNPASVQRYAFKRLVRIFPAYIPISLALIALYTAMPGFSASGGRDYSLVSSLLLLPADRPPALSVAWTLVHELMFYAVFLLFFVSRRWLVVGLVVWAGGIIVSNLAMAPSGWLRYPLSWLNIEFMLGVLSAWIVKSAIYQGSPQRLIVLGLSTAFIMLIVIHHDPSSYLRLLFAAGLACMMVGFSLWEKLVLLPWPGWLLLMGNASYSIYLIHNPLVSITQRLAARIGLEWAGAMVFGVFLSVFAGYVYYLFVERRSIVFFQNIFGKHKSDGKAHFGAN
jgi:exopolysaccharide production protein ExoZ